MDQRLELNEEFGLVKAIDRIMRAYSRTRVLTDDERRQVRGELLTFIQELLLGKQSAIEESKGPAAETTDLA